MWAPLFGDNYLSTIWMKLKYPRAFDQPEVFPLDITRYEFFYIYIVKQIWEVGKQLMTWSDRQHSIPKYKNKKIPLFYFSFALENYKNTTKYKGPAVLCPVPGEDPCPPFFAFSLVSSVEVTAVRVQSSMKGRLKRNSCMRLTGSLGSSGTFY